MIIKSFCNECWVLTTRVLGGGGLGGDQLPIPTRYKILVYGTTNMETTNHYFQKLYQLPIKSNFKKSKIKREVKQ